MATLIFKLDRALEHVRDHAGEQWQAALRTLIGGTGQVKVGELPRVHDYRAGCPATLLPLVSIITLVSCLKGYSSSMKVLQYLSIPSQTCTTLPLSIVR